VPKTYDIPQSTVDAIVAKTIMESDVYRVHFGEVNSQIMSLGSQARNAISKGNTEAAKHLIQEAYDTLRPYENSSFAKTASRMRRHIERIERLL
jgi:hypothetical protein